MSIEIDWTQHTRFNTDHLDLVGLFAPGRIVSVHDGDTMKAIVQAFPNEFRIVTLRLTGLDTPEISTKDLAEKTLAIHARDDVLKWLDPVVFATPPIAAKDVQARLDATPVIALIECFGQDKYGRELAKIHTERGCINDLLLSSKDADAYDGGTKERTWA